MLTTIALIGGLALAGVSGPTPSSTDEAREAAAAANSAPRASERPAPGKRIPSSTDEARELAGASLPTTLTRSRATVATTPTSTDEARGISPGRSMEARKDTRERVSKGCEKACACSRG
jgi:hypothetical protein